MSNIVNLSDHQKPVSYTIDVTHHYSGKVEIFVRDVSDDSRSIDAVIAFIIKWATQHMKARDIHAAMLERIDQLMDAQKDTPEAKELSALASACAAYEREAFPNVLAQDSVAEQETLQGQYDVYAAAREEYRKKIAEQAARIQQLEAAVNSAYNERNRLVALLARLFPSGVKRTAIPGWDEAWHGCVYIDLPTGQASWHYHDREAHLFEGLPPYSGEWDGHSTDEKYERIARAALKEAGDDL